MQSIFLAARGKGTQSNDNDPTQVSSLGAAVGVAGVALKTAPGRLYNLHVLNKAATAYVLMIFDKATAPVNGDTPVMRVRLPASSEVTIGPDQLGLFGRYFSLGVAFALSTAAAFDTLTLAAANDAHYDGLIK